MRAAAPRPTTFAKKAITTCGGWRGFEPEQSGCARQVAQINCGIEAARVHIQRNQTHLESLRRRYGVAWPRAVRSVSRTTARRFGQIDVARSRSGLPVRLGSARARPGVAFCCRSCNHSPITWRLCQRATTRTLSFSLAPLVRSARARCRISSGMFLLPLDLLSRDRADTKARAKGATKRAKRARFRFTRYAIQR